MIGWKLIFKWITANAFNLTVSLSFVSWICGMIVLLLADTLSAALSGFFLILPSIFHIRTLFSIVAQSGQSTAVERMASLAAMINSTQNQERRH